MTATAPTIGSFEIRSTLTGRAKALGLVILYLAVFALLLAILVFGLAGTGLAPAVRAGRLTPAQSFLRECADAAAAVLAVVVLAALTREPISRLGFATKAAGRNILFGLYTGFALMGGFFGALSASGGYDFAPGALPPGRILGFAVFYALFALAVAVFEETLFRSFILVQLSRAFSFWPAATITAILFGLAHAGNANEAPLGLLVAGLGGVVFAYAFRRTGALWFSIGFHAAMAYSEDFIFGVPDSGNVATGAWLHSTIHGPAWLTGGKVGPEGSVLALALVLTLALVVRFALPRREA
jgi:membrane protease YdiL (CAAX protease family)